MVLFFWISILSGATQDCARYDQRTYGIRAFLLWFCRRVWEVVCFITATNHATFFSHINQCVIGDCPWVDYCWMPTCMVNSAKPSWSYSVSGSSGSLALGRNRHEGQLDVHFHCLRLLAQASLYGQWPSFCGEFPCFSPSYGPRLHTQSYEAGLHLGPSWPLISQKSRRFIDEFPGQPQLPKLTMKWPGGLTMTSDCFLGIILRRQNIYQANQSSLGLEIAHSTQCCSRFVCACTHKKYAWCHFQICFHPHMYAWCHFP